MFPIVFSCFQVFSTINCSTVFQWGRPGRDQTGPGDAVADGGRAEHQATHARDPDQEPGAVRGAVVRGRARTPARAAPRVRVGGDGAEAHPALALPGEHRNIKALKPYYYYYYYCLNNKKILLLLLLLLVLHC